MLSPWIMDSTKVNFTWTDHLCLRTISWRLSLRSKVIPGKELETESHIILLVKGANFHEHNEAVLTVSDPLANWTLKAQDPAIWVKGANKSLEIWSTAITTTHLQTDEADRQILPSHRGNCIRLFPSNCYPYSEDHRHILCISENTAEK